MSCTRESRLSAMPEKVETCDGSRSIDEKSDDQLESPKLEMILTRGDERKDVGAQRVAYTLHEAKSNDWEQQ
jgi:hypothetical protein